MLTASQERWEARVMEPLLGGLCWHWSRCGRQSLVLGPEDSSDKARNSRLFPGTRQQQTCRSVRQGSAWAARRVEKAWAFPWPPCSRPPRASLGEGSPRGRSGRLQGWVLLLPHRTPSASLVHSRGGPVTRLCTAHLPPQHGSPGARPGRGHGCRGSHL